MLGTTSESGILLPLSQRVAFSIFALLTILLGARGFYRVYLRIANGRADADRRTDDIPARLWHALTTTLLQTRVFRRRRVLSVFHAFIFYAFVLYLLVNLVDAIDGFYDLRPLASPLLRGIYGGLADTFSVLAIVGIIAFVFRRFFLRSKRDFRFNRLTLLQDKIRGGYIQRDSAIVSAFILFHVGSRIIGNAARLALAGPEPSQPFSSALAPLFASHAMAWRVFGYWGALGSVLLFLIYFPYTKHIHLLMAPVKYFLRRDAGSGELPPVNIDLEAVEPQIGAARLGDLSWPRLLDAYACIQCNRCQDVCPASRTGKALSPAALEINKRMVLNSIAEETSAFSLAGGPAFERHTAAGPALLEAVISPEAVWACTTCGACMQVCPTQDEQMLDIIDIRRNMVMLQGEFPPALQNAFRGMERTSNPWAISRDKRMEWAGSLHVPTVDEVPDPDVLYWVGCAASYDPGAQKTARAVVQLLQHANIKFAVLGKRESCTGDTARRAGNELLYQQMATAAVQTLNEVRPRLVLASCPHCVNTIASEYPQFGGNFTVMHHTEYLESLVSEGKLRPAAADNTITFHDPCYLGRHRGTYDQPRSVLKVLTNDFVELPRTRSNAFCCGAGGAQFWKEEEPGDERISENRFREAQQTLNSKPGEKVLAVGCPFCKSMLQSSPSAADAPAIGIKDIAELLWEGVQRANGIDTRVQSALTAETPAPIAPPESRNRVREPIATAPEPGTRKNGSIPPTSSESPTGPRSSPTSSAADSIQSTDPATPDDNAPHGPSARKKWTPKPATTPPSSEPAEPAIPATQQESPAPTTETPAPLARKKWSPKPAAPATAKHSAEQPAPPTPQAEPAPETTAPTAAPARKKWAPRATQPADTPQLASDLREEARPQEPSTATPETSEVPSQTPRKKWQPKRPQ